MIHGLACCPAHLASSDISLQEPGSSFVSGSSPGSSVPSPLLTPAVASLQVCVQCPNGDKRDTLAQVSPRSPDCTAVSRHPVLGWTWRPGGGSQGSRPGGVTGPREEKGLTCTRRWAALLPAAPGEAFPVMLRRGAARPAFWADSSGQGRRGARRLRGARSTFSRERLPSSLCLAACIHLRLAPTAGVIGTGSREARAGVVSQSGGPVGESRYPHVQTRGGRRFPASRECAQQVFFSDRFPFGFTRLAPIQTMLLAFFFFF